MTLNFNNELKQNTVKQKNEISKTLTHASNNYKNKNLWNLNLTDKSNG